MVIRDEARPPCLQVAALPWRVDAKGRTRLLLITSRNSKRWMLPKGWPMAGMALHEAASIEAMEEAGAEGVISSTPVGSYRYAKLFNDGSEQPAEAVVFPLRVDMLHNRWRERGQRDRRWFSPKDAAAAVFERDLARLLLALPSDFQQTHWGDDKELFAAGSVTPP